MLSAVAWRRVALVWRDEFRLETDDRRIFRLNHRKLLGVGREIQLAVYFSGEEIQLVSGEQTLCIYLGGSKLASKSWERLTVTEIRARSWVMLFRSIDVGPSTSRRTWRGL